MKTYKVGVVKSSLHIYHIDAINELDAQSMALYGSLTPSEVKDEWIESYISEDIKN